LDTFRISRVHRIGQRLHVLLMVNTLGYIKGNMKDVGKKMCKTKVKRKK
jgi:hypothetical protein